MKEITGTIYSAEIQTAQFHKIPYLPRANTTLNEALQVSANVPLADGEYPAAAYMVLGMGGHRLTASAGGKPKISPIRHRPTDANLYELVPQVVRLETDDLTAEQRKKYCLRKKEVHHGKNCVVYYGRRIDLSKTETKLFKVTVTNGVTTSVPFVPSTDNLKPTPPIISPNEVVPSLADGNYLMVNAVTTVQFSKTDIDEYVNAVSMVYNDPELAVISEVGIVSGVDRKVNYEGIGGSTIEFDECCVATLAQIVSTYENLNFANAEFNMIVNAGVTRASLTEA